MQLEYDDTERKSYLQNILRDLKDEHLAHYTVIDCEKINENISDINKYQMKKIEAIPIKDRDLNMDHLCFVDIFPRGRGGMYDQRSFKQVQPAMYLR